MDNEVWKPIEGYEGYYSVSNLGRVRSEERMVKHRCGYRKAPSKILSQNCHSNGYLSTQLHKEGFSKRMLVHRLVASAFLDNPCDLPEVNHLDCNKTNNTLPNLEWSSKANNTQHANINDRNLGTQRLTVEQIHYIRDNVITGVGGNVAQLAEMFSVSISCVYRIISGRTWSYV